MKVRYILQGTTEVIEERESTELPVVGPVNLAAGLYRVLETRITPNSADSYDAIVKKGHRPKHTFTAL